MKEQFVPGRLVSSIAGRDAGKYYIIYNVLSPRMVEVVDGEGRGISAPKKKNIKHLKPYPQLAKEIMDKRIKHQKIDDLDFRKALERLLSEVFK